MIKNFVGCYDYDLLATKQPSEKEGCLDYLFLERRSALPSSITEDPNLLSEKWVWDDGNEVTPVVYTYWAKFYHSPEICQCF
jgi:hypothetical protein